MKFSSINIQGNILSSEILDKIRTEEKFKHQSPEAFGLSRSASLRDEIGHAWAIMRTHWQAYTKRLETLPQGDTGTSLTRERLIIPLLAELGYEVSRQKAQQIDGNSYAISHGAVNRNDFPIHIMGYKDNLDKRRESGGPRLSPHALVQEYLNSTEHLFALVTNGKQLRLLRDSTRLVRMSYLEFDLQHMFEEELYADFSILFRVLHSSRMPEKIDAGPDSVIEYYHQESMASGTRIREKLSEAVEESIKTLANGFLNHRKNEDLIQLIEDNRVDANTFYTHQLRLIYRVLFLIVLEERNLIYPEEPSEEQKHFRNIYYKYYSIERLRKLTENRVYVDADKFDLWESLKTTFLLFEDEHYGSKIGIKPLGSGLFAPNALGNLKSQFLNNGLLIKVLKYLTTFVNDQKQLVRVNYSDLDVEEFGSVYEGLLEYDPVIDKIGAQWQFSFVVGDGRSSSGSHYTPEELVKPLIKHSLDYVIADKLLEDDPEKALLSITVCDVACGSGHILLSAARRIAIELASIREGAEQPSPTYYRSAIRDVIRNCIYGVDLNPLAVELCKVALWLEAHSPNEPLNFLDHHIKNGNAIVGLALFEELENGIANEAFKTLPSDNKVIASEFKKRNALERKTKQISTYDVEKADLNLQGLLKEFAEFIKMPENTPEEIKLKSETYNALTKDKKWYRLNNLANLQVAQFFIPKTKENKEKLTTNAKYRTYLNTGAQILDRGAANAVAIEKRFFHWFLEFPEVFGNGGFDCILGNPPFLGGLRISTNYGDNYYRFLKYNYKNTAGTCDLVAYFFRRIHEIINPQGIMSLIATNTISQGDTREGGLDVILTNGGDIIFGIKSMKWPGIAALEVSLLSISKKDENLPKYLSTQKVGHINSLIEEGELIYPEKLKINSGISFAGTTVLGKGFVLSSEQAKNILSRTSNNKAVICKYLSGNDVNSSPNQTPSRYVINFHDWPIEKAQQFEVPFSILERDVYPVRMKDKRKAYRDRWWLFAERRVELYKSIETLDQIIISCRVTKYLSFSLVQSTFVYDVGTNVIAKDNYLFLSIFQSSIHNEWAWKFGSTLETRLRYTNVDCIETFPFPSIDEFNSELGKQFFHLRNIYMEENDLGLTKFYNQFHDSKRLTGKLNKIRNTFKDLDESVKELFGWHTDTDRWGKAINLRHDFYEVDYLPENDRVRYTIHPEARREVLKRLLILNHERYEEEIKQGLHKRKDVKAFYKQKGKEIPEGTKCADDKKPRAKKKVSKVKEPQAQYGQGTLFEEANLFNQNNLVGLDNKVTFQKKDGTNFKYHIFENAEKGKFTGEYKQIKPTSTLAENMFGRKVGHTFLFGGVEYKILEVE